MNRRRFGIDLGAMLISPRFLKIGASGRQAQPATSRSYSEQMPDMLVSYLSGELNELAAARDAMRARLITAADLKARNAYVKQRTLEMLHGLPLRTPLSSTTVKVIERPGYRIENVMFQSRPDFWVTGNLYVPTFRSGVFPAIISPCGHYALARMLPQYQSAYLTFVKSGFVVLAYDPVGQGERRQYWNPQTNVTDVGGATYEHSMAGQLLLLLGENLTQYRVWDGMRAIDYLLTRSEVDAQKIGCAGHSGGATLTKFLSVVDERVRCAAIIEGGTADRWPLTLAPWEPLGPSDVEQNLFPAAHYGVDNIDLHVAIAPRPLLVATEEYTREFEQAAEAIRARYRQLSAPEKFMTIAAGDPHAWTAKLRLAAADWFSRWFYGQPGPLTQPPFQTEPPQALYCTPNGSIRYSQRGETIFSMIVKKQSQLPPPLEPPRTAEERRAFAADVRQKIRRLLRFEKSDAPLSVRRLMMTPRTGYRIEKLEFLSQPGIYIPTWVYVPDHKAGILPTILFISDEGIENEGMEFEGAEGSGVMHGVLDSLVRAGNLVVAVDVRGIGETRPPHASESDGRNQFQQLFDVETAMSYMAWFMDRSLLGMRVQDVARSVDYVMSRDDADRQHLQVIGKGNAGLWCLYAAALDTRIQGLICVRSLASYRALTQVDRYLYAADVFIPGVLQQLDLPQVAAALVGRPLALVRPNDAMKNVMEFAAAQDTYRWTQSAYVNAGMPHLFHVESGGPELEGAEHYLALMRAFNTVR